LGGGVPLAQQGSAGRHFPIGNSLFSLSPPARFRMDRVSGGVIKSRQTHQK